MSLDESEQKIDVREGIVHSIIPADELGTAERRRHRRAEDRL